MSKPDYLDQLIDKASKAAGSDYKLAQMLETSRFNVSNWRHGKKPCPVGDVALMAEIAGLEVQEWLARAVVEQYHGTSKGEKLYMALGKVLAATGAAVVSVGASAEPIFSTAKNVGHFIRCIVLLSRKPHPA